VCASARALPARPLLGWAAMAKIEFEFEWGEEVCRVNKGRGVGARKQRDWRQAASAQCYRSFSIRPLEAEQAQHPRARPLALRFVGRLCSRCLLGRQADR